MMVVYGTRKKLKTVKPLGRMRCTNCGHEVDASLAREGGYFHICFIPVFPHLGYKMILCPCCGIMKKLTNEEYKDMKSGSQV